MENSSRSFFLRRKWAFEWTILTIFVVELFVEVAGDKNCPVSAGTLYAYPEGDTYEFKYTFDSLIKTNIDLIDRFLTNDDEVICDWEVRAKESHYASISFDVFQLSEQSRSKHGDCLSIYDGKSVDQPLLAELCGGDVPEDSYTSSSGRFLLLVFKQGERTGPRYFRMKYEAVPRPKDLIIKIAGIVSGCVAAIGIVFLACKFTRSCHVCRKRCCPQQFTEEEAPSQRELRPLTPVALVPPSVTDAREDNFRNEERAIHQSGVSSRDAERNERNLLAARQTGQGQPLSSVGGEVGDDDQLSLPPDEAPPSYDSIFGETGDGSKPNP